MTRLSFKVFCLCAILALCYVLPLAARTKTTRAALAYEKLLVEPIGQHSADSGDSGNGNIPADAITLRGFTKRASDAKESFFVTNNLDHAISHPRITLRYLSMAGETLHERQVELNVKLEPGMTRLVEVKTFDIQRMFYFYAGPKPRKSATPFKVKFHLDGYDIPVGK